jgi:hypothetical protein
MPSWIVDDPTLACVILGLAALLFGACWWFTRERWLAIAVGIFAGLTALVLLLFFLIDTDAKQIKRRIRAMADAVGIKDADRIFEHFSEQFVFLGLYGKQSFRERAMGYVQRGEVQSISVWGFEPRDIDREQKKATMLFKAKATGIGFKGIEYFRVRASFVLDPDGQWRLREFWLYDPMIDPATGPELKIPF